MPITISSIQTAANYFRRSTETADFTADKSLEAAALAVEDVHSYANYKFTQRIQRFEFLDGEADYILSDTQINIGVQVPDFRAPKDLRKSVDHDDDFDYVSPNEFALSYGSSKTDKIYTVEQRDGGVINNNAANDWL